MTYQKGNTVSVQRCFVKLLALSGALLWLAGCTQTIILFKPSKYLDPLPLAGKPASEQKADPLLKEQWNLNKIGADETRIYSNQFAGNYNVRVAILSTGVDYNHEDLIGQIDINRSKITPVAIGELPVSNTSKPLDDGNVNLDVVNDVVGYDVVDNDGFAYDRHGAGTAIAGIIGARQNNGVGIAGLMKEVTLYPIRYINDNGQTDVSKLVAALNVVVQKRPNVVFIQNTQLRFGGQKNDPQVAQAEMQFLREALAKVAALKIPIVTGAGDDMADFGNNDIERVLRSFDNIIVVTSSDREDNLSFLANFSFTNVLTAAPGDAVITTLPGNKYGPVSGTAVAAAHITAALALARAQLGDRVGLEKLTPVLTSASGSDQVRGLMRVSQGGNRLNMVKFLNEIQKL